jgi:hypothetical protein
MMIKTSLIGTPEKKLDDKILVVHIAREDKYFFLIITMELKSYNTFHFVHFQNNKIEVLFHSVIKYPHNDP